MTRYAELYFSCQDQLNEAKMSLHQVQTERDNYRAYIHGHGLTCEFMVWWAEKQGYGSGVIAELRAAFEGAKVGSTPSEPPKCAK